MHEFQIVVLIRHGLTSDAITKVMPWEFSTINNHRVIIRKKLGLKKGETLYQAIMAI